MSKKGKKQAIELESTVPHEGTVMQNPALRNFLLNVEEVRKKLKSIQNIVQQFHEATENMMLGQEKPGSSEELASMVKQSGTYFTAAQKRLQLLREENDKLKQEKKVGPTILRIRKNHVDVLSSKLISLMKDYRDIQEQHKAYSENKIARQMREVNPNITDAQIKEAVENNDPVFMKGVMAQKNDEKLELAAKQALAYVQSKHNDIVMLVESIAELRQMFIDLAVLVERQGEIINKIEDNCSKALAYTKEGTADLQKASQHAKSSSKLMCYILIVVVIVMCIVVLAVLGPIIYNVVMNLTEEEDPYNPPDLN
ncbi:Syntaxin-1A [Entamoeba marina]